MKSFSQFIFAVTFFVFLFGCAAQQNKKQQSVIQISTIDALLQGVYDGQTTLENLRELGDFGIGTFNGLDGEMIFVDGEFYQVKSDGKIYKPAADVKTPFASVTRFEEEQVVQLGNNSYESFKLLTDSLMQTVNLFFAIKLKGEFSYIKTRSVPAQTKPYPSLLEVTKNQPEFEATNISGQLVGFYCPKFVKGINVPEYHLHFLSDDKKFGGHLLEFRLEKGSVTLDKIERFEMILPNEGDFLKSEFETDRSGELKKVES
jgi:acetolactate decarboxylase